MNQHDTHADDGLNDSQHESGNSGEGQSPLLLHDMQFTEEGVNLAVGGSSRSRPAIVAVLVVVAAVGSLFAMRQLGLGPALSLADVTVEYKPEEGGNPGVASGKVLADLERSRRAVQVPAEHITQDPFELNADQNVDVAPRIDADLERNAELERQRLAREARQREIEDAFGELTLQSVALGAKPVARINGELYRKGMTIAEYFIITEISGREVTLFADDSTFTLSLDASPSKPRRPRSGRNR